MHLTKRHQEVLDSLKSFDSTLEVVEFRFDLSQIRVSKKIKLYLSNRSVQPDRLGTEECRLVNQKWKFRTEEAERLICAGYGGISIRRLFQINNTSSFSWSMITTEKYAERDFERFKRFVTKRLAYFQKIASSSFNKLPKEIVEKLKSSIVVTDASKEGKGVDPIHTACRDCIFALYENKTQVGCSFQNRLEHFRNLGAVVEVFDNELEFSVINKRYCSARRDTNYLVDLKRPPGSTIAEIVRKEIAVRVDYIIVLSQTSTLAELEDSIKSIVRQSLTPHSIIVASNQTTWRPSKLATVLEKVAGEVPWQVVNLLLREKDGSLLPDWAAVDEAFGKCKGHFYTRINAGVTLPRKFGEQIDVSLTDNLEQFTVLEAEESLPAEVVHCAFHNYAKGNQKITVGIPKETPAMFVDAKFNGVDGLHIETEKKEISTLPEKAKFYEDAGNTDGMLRKVTDICK